MYAALMTVPLPGINARAAASAGSALSLLALGVAPGTTAFVFVEFAALLPCWRRLRVSFDGRAKLERAAAWGMMLLAAMQVYGTVLSIEGLDRLSGKERVLEGSGAVVGLGLFAGAILAFFVARTITRLGLINGFVVLLLVHEARHFASLQAAVASASSSQNAHPLALLIAFALPIAATVACFPSASSSTEGSLPGLELPIPASSIQPIAFVTALINVPVILGVSFGSIEPARRWALHYGQNPVIVVSLVIVVGLVLSWFLNRPSRLQALFSHALPSRVAKVAARQTFRNALLPTLLFLTTLELSELLVSQLFDVWNAARLLPIVTIVVLDFAIALRAHHGRALACAWREPRPYATAAIVRWLRHSGIEASALSERQAALCRFFSPYVMTEIWVPETDATHATALISEFLSDERAETDEDGDGPSPALAIPAQTRIALVLAGLAVTGCVTLLASRR